MAKIHKTVRVEEDTYNTMQSLRSDGENDTDLFNRVLKVGTDVLHNEYKQAQAQATNAEESNQRIDDLKHMNKLLEEQLTAKDKQIETLSELAKNAQMVAGMTSANTKQALEQTTQTNIEPSEKPTLKERMRNFFS